MGTVLATIAICITLTIVGLFALMTCKPGSAYDDEVEREHELSNAEVTAIITKRA